MSCCTTGHHRGRLLHRAAAGSLPPLILLILGITLPSASIDTVFTIQFTASGLVAENMAAYFLVKEKKKKLLICAQ